ncbi:small RNA degrading nuclease 5 [Drosophila guanche]|uniref:Blast:Putative RNA exonuclease NEF-sp n=3 Tax=Drosophila guanche TaxID=7266 RepID=A0A3B0KGQ2_DROGU|nr:small RNA degrading nuclease 5 [Drosophila guanche]SPP87600.1 blast:Putative RNA exonuclease NEF-sp [Drosophila guanche]
MKIQLKIVKNLKSKFYQRKSIQEEMKMLPNQQMDSQLSELSGRLAMLQLTRAERLQIRLANMKEQVSAKQQERSDKKKKKLAALANLMDLNDRDRLHEAELAKKRDSEPKSSGPETMEDDGFCTVSSKRKTKNRHTIRSTPERPTEADPDKADEPQSKRIRNDEEAGGDNIPGDTLVTLSEEQYKALSADLRRRKRRLQDFPALRLREMGQRALLETPQDARTPIFLSDIQNLLMSGMIGQKSPCRPDRWCSIEKWVSLSHSVVVILEGLSLYHYLSNESQFEASNKIFNTKLELMLPQQGEGMIIDEIAQIPLTSVQAKKLIDQHGSLESAVALNKDPTLFVRGIFPIEGRQEPGMELPQLHPDDKFPRTKLLLSALQMVDEGYPIPLQGELHSRFRSYKFTKKSYKPVTNRSPMYGVDCEMCRTVAGVNELTRISIVDEEYKTVYETLVMPDNRITDYLTQYSGITEDIMKQVTKQLKDVQKEVSALLPDDAILVGQSLNSDLNAMRMMHPYVIDTSVCFNISGVRRRKSKLKHLAMTFLKETIQENEYGHDSIEDSRATLKLVKMKLANSIEFGDEILTQHKRLQEIANACSGDSITNNMFAYSAKRDRRTAIVNVGGLQPRLKELIEKAEQVVPKDNSTAVLVHEVATTKEAVRKVTEIALENSLTIANLSIPEEDFLLDRAERSAVKIDKVIERLWNTVAHNGLFLVLMGGSTECPKGVAKIAIKRLNGTEQTSAPIGC